MHSFKEWKVSFFDTSSLMIFDFIYPAAELLLSVCDNLPSTRLRHYPDLQLISVYLLLAHRMASYGLLLPGHVLLVIKEQNTTWKIWELRSSASWIRTDVDKSRIGPQWKRKAPLSLASKCPCGMWPFNISQISKRENRHFTWFSSRIIRKILEVIIGVNKIPFYHYGPFAV